MKICSRCANKREVEMFENSRNGGLYKTCKKCRIISNRSAKKAYSKRSLSKEREIDIDSSDRYIAFLESGVK
jgi:Zn-finger protein